MSKRQTDAVVKRRVERVVDAVLLELGVIDSRVLQRGGVTFMAGEGQRGIVVEVHVCQFKGAVFGRNFRFTEFYKPEVKLEID